MLNILTPAAGELELRLDGKLLLRHTADTPAFFLGYGRERIRMYRGNFDIDDRLQERLPLTFAGAEADGAATVLRFIHPSLAGEYRLRVWEHKGLWHLEGSCGDERPNRLWLRLCAEETEHVMGGGEQFSALDLRGRTYPIWTRERRRQRRRRRGLPHHFLPPAELPLLPALFRPPGKLRIQ